jgi:hypothetical protein
VITLREAGAPRLTKKIAPRDAKAQELATLLEGPAEGRSGEEFLRTLGQLATERGVQEA